MKPWAWIVIGVSVLVVIAALVLLQTPHSFLNLGSSQISVSTSTISTSTTEYTIDAEYPQFGIPAVDSQIKMWVENSMNDLITQADTDMPAENGYPMYEFTSSFSNAYIGPDYISVPLVLAQYTGGAHEMPVIIGATFDRATGQPVTLDEALALTGMSLDQVASSSKEQLAQNPDTAPTGMWASGSDPVADNYSTFLINQTDVTFIFQPYQVAPYSSGAPEVSIPRIK